MQPAARPGPAARAAVWIMSVVVLGVLPFVALYSIFLNANGTGVVTDFEQAFYVAAGAILDGDSPYPAVEDAAVASGTAYVYPPLTALASVPLTLLDSQVAGVLVMGLLAATVVATLLLLDVRDWRCYGIAFLWPPVLSAIQTGNITIVLGLGAALVWRFRDDARAAGATLGVGLAAKLILWPLVVWLAATRRVVGTGYALGVGAVVLFMSWGVIGFAGLKDYPELLRRLQELERADGYTVYALVLDLGAPARVAATVWIGLALVLLTAVVVLGRRGEDRHAFVVAIAAALACSPIVWLHYFALLLVAVAIAEPKLGLAWFVPLLMYTSTGTHNGTTLQTAVTIAAAGLTIVVALRVSRSLPVGWLEPARSVRLRGSP